MRTSVGAGARKGQGQGSAFRPIDIVFSCAMGALLIVLIVEYAKSSSADEKATRAARDTREISQRLDGLSTTLAGIENDLADLRLARADAAALKRRLDTLESRPATTEMNPADLSAAVDAALERRRDAFTVDMERRGEAIAKEVANEFARRVDLKGFEGGIRRTAENFRAGRREEGAPERTERQKKADEAVAKGFDAAAEGMELFRKMQAGEITREEMREKMGEIREKARKQFEDLDPADRDAIRDRWGGFGRRRDRDEGGDGKDEGGDEKF